MGLRIATSFGGPQKGIEAFYWPGCFLDSRRGTRNPARVQHVLQLPRTECTANSKSRLAHPIAWFHALSPLLLPQFQPLPGPVRKKIEVLLRQQDPHFLPTACMSVQLAYEPVPTRPLRPTWP